MKNCKEYANEPKQNISKKMNDNKKGGKQSRG